LLASSTAFVQDGCFSSIQQDGKMLVPLYESMIGEVIVWPSFASTSINRDFVLSTFIKGDDILLFEIVLRPAVLSERTMSIGRVFQSDRRT
jgi:hypothetical protein